MTSIRNRDERYKEEWLAVHLSKWTGFGRTEVRFHEVGGLHYTMMGAGTRGCVSEEIEIGAQG